MRARTAVVTGASQGLGAGIASELARSGMQVVGLSRRGIVPEDVHLGLVCDVTDDHSVRAALAEAVARFGAIDVLVNNAGIHTAGSSATLATVEFERVLQTNALGTFIPCREAYPYLAAAGGGVIVNIGSFWDRMGAAKNTAYVSSKAAVGAITRCLAVEWARDAIAVLDVAPAYVESPFNTGYLGSEAGRAMLERNNPQKRAATIDEVARLVAKLVCDPIPYLSGETIYVDAGQGIAHQR